MRKSSKFFVLATEQAMYVLDVETGETTTMAAGITEVHLGTGL